MMTRWETAAGRGWRWRTGTLSLIAAALVAGLCGCGRELPPNLSADVAAGNTDWIEGLRVGDAARIAASYAPDAVFCGASGECVKGVAAVTALYEGALRQRGRALAASVHSADLRVDGDLAYESGRAEAQLAGGRVLQGRYCTVWKRQPDGHWKIFRNLSL